MTEQEFKEIKARAKETYQSAVQNTKDRDALLAEVKRLQAERDSAAALLKRAKYIMVFHSDRCNVNPMHNFNGSEEHCAEYRHVVMDIENEIWRGVQENERKCEYT